MSDDTLTGDSLAAAVAGALETEVTRSDVQPWRLPAAARRYAPPALALMSEFGAGVRLRLRTAASRITIEATVTRLVQRGRDAPGDPAAFVAVSDGAVLARVDLTATSLVHEAEDRSLRRGPAAPLQIVLDVGAAPSERVVEILLPQDAGTRLHRLVADAPVTAAAPPTAPRWTHHGSSISHGGNADGPLGPWPRTAAAHLGLDGVNLGFGGNAMLDPLVARAIARTDFEVLSLKIGINIVGADAMRRRTFLPALHGFLDTVRDAHPTTPILLVTAIACPGVETTPGPIRAGVDGRATGTPREVRAGDGTLTLRGSREAVTEVHAERVADDPALHLLDGTTLLGAHETDLLPDGLHPAQAGYDLIARRFADAALDPSTDTGRAFEPALARR